MGKRQVRVITEEVKEVDDSKGGAAVVGLVAGAIIGGILGGPGGAVVGGGLGLAAGASADDDEKDK